MNISLFLQSMLSHFGTEFKAMYFIRGNWRAYLSYHYQKASHWIVKLPLMKDSRTNGGISGGGNYILLFGFRALLRKHCFTSENKEKSFGFTYKLYIYLQEIHTKVNVFSTFFRENARWNEMNWQNVSKFAIF